MNCTRWMNSRRVVIRSSVFLFIVAGLALSFLSACKSKTNPSSAEQVQAPKDSLELVFVYGSEKEKWINEVTDKFNREDHRAPGGKRIYVRPVAMGSGESVDEVLSGRLQAHLISPASAAFIKLGNSESQSKSGKDLVGSTENLVLSPVVIAMWKPMAEAIGWGKKPIGWADILALARNSKGWDAYGYPQWGQFKFGHTHPQFSNSGLISLFAEVYAAAGKTAGLTLSDVSRHTAEFVEGIEKSIVHYGSSTGFFGRKMFATGPQYLSAAVLYENMVIESYNEPNLPFPVVAIYPKEGTFWSDHPIGVVERDWVTPAHRDAAKIYTQYLLARPQQERAIAYGFRPGSVDVSLASPIDESHGVDPKEPKTTLEVPSVAVMDAILKLWDQKKKSANVVLVMDTSGSMNEGGKIQNAREGAKQLVNLLSPQDQLSLVPFNSTIQWASTDVPLKTGRDQLVRTIDSLFAQNGTALYDSIDAGYQHLLDERKPGGDDRILSVIVLTDGDDTESKMKLAELMQRIKFDGETHTIHVFTIAYGADAKKAILQQISDATQAKSYAGNPKNIVEVFRDIFHILLMANNISITPPTSDGPRLTALGKLAIFLFILACFAGAYYLFMGKKAFRETQNKATSLLGGGPQVEIGVAYGTEKQKWLEWAVSEFEKTSEGKHITVNLIPMGSLEGAHALVNGDKRINVWSPASAAYKDTFVQEWQVKYSDNPIIKEEPLALTPMVFVVWEERYKPFVDKYKVMSFNTINQALQEKTGWDAIAHQPDWGLFKFGHTHPNQSNSGLMAIVLAAYSFQHKTKDLAVRDVVSPDFQQWLTNLERGTSGLSNSTGNMMREMVLKGPSSYDAMLVYESVAIDYLKNAEGRWGQLRVVYPEYNIWNDNPYYIVNAPWSTSDQRKAADTFLSFLLSEPIQRESLKHGFRPANTNVPVKFPESPFVQYAGSGVQVDLQKICDPPKAEVVENLLASWQRTQGNR